MEKNKKKKATGAPKSVKHPSDYKSRESEGKVSKTDATFHKVPTKSKATARKS